jgi:hypothetical protein
MNDFGIVSVWDICCLEVSSSIWKMLVFIEKVWATSASSEDLRSLQSQHPQGHSF